MLLHDLMKIIHTIACKPKQPTWHPPPPKKNKERSIQKKKRSLKCNVFYLNVVFFSEVTLTTDKRDFCFFIILNLWNVIIVNMFTYSFICKSFVFFVLSVGRIKNLNNLLYIKETNESLFLLYLQRWGESWRKRSRLNTVEI